MCIYDFTCDKCTCDISDCLEDLIFTDESLENCCCEEELSKCKHYDDLRLSMNRDDKSYNEYIQEHFNG